MLSRAELGKIARNQQQLLQRLRLQAPPWHEPHHKQHDNTLSAALSAHSNDAVTYCQRLIDYFWPAFLHYLTADGCRAYYPGYASIYGATNDGIEGVSRTLPLWAAYSSSPLAEPQLAQAMLTTLRETLLNGTNPAHRYYWGTISDKSTLICEAADIALALWLARTSLWPQFNTAQQQQILNWLKQVPGKATADNNWHLFVAQVDAVVSALDPQHQFSSQARLQRLNTFYLGDGCYRDGADGAVDLYNAWGFHYHFFWLSQILPQHDFSTQQQHLLQYCDWFQHLFTEQGTVLYGRSLCYRFAMPAPLLIRACCKPTAEHQAIAASTLLRTWQFFIKNNGLTKGRPSQGVFDDDEYWLDPYSGPASGFWGCRSLVLFYALSPQLPWQHTALLPLPLQTAALQLTTQAGVLTKAANSQLVTLQLPAQKQPLSATAPASGNKVIARLKSLLYACSCRPAHNLQKMGQTEFSSDLRHYQPYRRNT